MPIIVNMVLERAHRLGFVIIVFSSALVVSSCAALQPPNVTGPRGNSSLYPILLIEDAHRKEATVAALNRLGQQSGKPNGTLPQLQPVTGTIIGLPPQVSGSFFLPKVGAGASMNEEETRESLRRFIREWQELIGSDPAKLSLIERTDQPDGSKLAIYQQRPFRYPIRGNYGKLEIHFSGDRRVLNLTSSCIPDADRIQSALSALNVRPRAEETLQKLRANGLTYVDSQGIQRNFAIAASSEMTARQMTIYILPAKDQPETLEFHLAWEIEFTNAPIKLAYVDSLNGDVLATE
jgi:hypothetical protein